MSSEVIEMSDSLTMLQDIPSKEKNDGFKITSRWSLSYIRVSQLILDSSSVLGAQERLEFKTPFVPSVRNSI